MESPESYLGLADAPRMPIFAFFSFKKQKNYSRFSSIVKSTMPSVSARQTEERERGGWGRGERLQITSSVKVSRHEIWACSGRRELEVGTGDFANTKAHSSSLSKLKKRMNPLSHILLSLIAQKHYFLTLFTLLKVRQFKELRPTFD